VSDGDVPDKIDRATARKRIANGEKQARGIPFLTREIESRLLFSSLPPSLAPLPPEVVRSDRQWPLQRTADAR